MSKNLSFKKIFCFILCLGISKFAVCQYKPFSTQDYSPEFYKVKNATYSFKNVVAKLIKVNTKSSIESDFYCRAWLHVYINDTITDSIYFDNMVSNKGCSGIYAETEQPLTDYLILVKYGDYDGRTIIVDGKGKIHNLEGGRYFITRDKRFLFSIYESDLSGLTVYDFKFNKIAFQNDTLKSKLTEWYFQEGRYFSLDQEAEEDEIESDNPNFVLSFTIKQFDFIKRQLRTEKLPFDNLRQENAIALKPRFKQKPDCICK
jgi:hypothetical protein